MLIKPTPNRKQLPAQEGGAQNAHTAAPQCRDEPIWCRKGACKTPAPPLCCRVGRAHKRSNGRGHDIHVQAGCVRHKPRSSPALGQKEVFAVCLCRACTCTQPRARTRRRARALAEPTHPVHQQHKTARTAQRRARRAAALHPHAPLTDRPSHAPLADCVLLASCRTNACAPPGRRVWWPPVVPVPPRARAPAQQSPVPAKCQQKPGCRGHAVLPCPLPSAQRPPVRPQSPRPACLPAKMRAATRARRPSAPQPRGTQPGRPQ